MGSVRVLTYTEHALNCDYIHACVMIEFLTYRWWSSFQQNVDQGILAPSLVFSELCPISSINRYGKFLKKLVAMLNVSFSVASRAPNNELQLCHPYFKT